MTIQQYVKDVEKLYYSGKATEHSYRSALQRLVEHYGDNVNVTNEPKRVKCGAPDYIISKKDIPIGYIEAKDVVSGILDKKETKAQVKKYFGGGLGYNFILTDYLEFRFYREETLVETIRIAEPNGKALVIDSSKFDQLGNLLSNFCQYHGQTITSSRKLAEMMAAKARMIQTVIFNALQDEEDGGGELRSQFEAFQNILMHDMKEKQFSDMYAQTITYGLFAARLHDPTLKTFSRMEAAELLPKTNPFLRQLFVQIGAINLDTRLQWIVDDLVELFKACNVREILEDYGKVTQRNDPIVHFYEDFLAEYDSALRKSRGVWYTPEPVVDFIVRAVDEVLKTEFGLPDGLADTSKTKMKIKVRQYAKNRKKDFREEYVDTHRVQILDPATGTGTFLARVLQEIYSNFENMPALWKGYVNKDLLPRIHGFEILMASYAMAHLKLDLVLRETGAEPDKRFNVFLTNSLEEAHPDTGTLFAQWLSQESSEANRVKRDTPIMCVIGNPPYAVSSSNKGNWIQGLIGDYKKNLHERKINLDDDYIKFLRYAEYFIEKSGQGVIAMITNNSYLDGVTHRQMRKHLLQTFDKIFIYNLHGDAKKKEISPDGSIDQNVFDIQQGVGLIIALKTETKKNNSQGQILYYDSWGTRENKYNNLLSHSIGSKIWSRLECSPPYFFFVPKNFEGKDEYANGIKLNTLFKLVSTGIESQRDNITIHFSDTELASVVNDLIDLDSENFKSKYNIKDGRDWKVATAKKDIINQGLTPNDIYFRPFDIRRTYFTGSSKGFHAYPRAEVMQNLLLQNYALISVKLNRKYEGKTIFLAKGLVDKSITSSLDNSYVFPLYVYQNAEQISFEKRSIRYPNLDLKIVSEVAEKLSLSFIPDHELPEAGEDATFTPLDLLDYIYAVLHSPNYRKKYKEFLKIDFPRIPYPEDQETFWKLVKLGGELRSIHLMESFELNKSDLTIDGGDNLTVDKIGKKSYDEKNQRVYINDEVYFEGVPKLAWEFYIGGYQPAQKWLKDRKGRTLDYNDVKHYMKIIKALIETDRIMQEIDKVKEF